MSTYSSKTIIINIQKATIREVIRQRRKIVEHGVMGALHGVGSSLEVLERTAVHRICSEQPSDGKGLNMQRKRVSRLA